MTSTPLHSGFTQAALRLHCIHCNKCRASGCTGQARASQKGSVGYRGDSERSFAVSGYRTCSHGCERGRVLGPRRRQRLPALHRHYSATTAPRAQRHHRHRQPVPSITTSAIKHSVLLMTTTTKHSVLLTHGDRALSGANDHGNHALSVADDHH